MQHRQFCAEKCANLCLVTYTLFAVLFSFTMMQNEICSCTATFAMQCSDVGATGLSEKMICRTTCASQLGTVSDNSTKFNYQPNGKQSIGFSSRFDYIKRGSELVSSCYSKVSVPLTTEPLFFIILDQFYIVEIAFETPALFPYSTFFSLTHPNGCYVLLFPLAQL